MLKSNWRDELPGRVRTLQIIIAALTMGCIFFAVVVLVVASLASANAGTEFVTFSALGLAAVAMVPRVVAPAIMVAEGRKGSSANCGRNRRHRNPERGQKALTTGKTKPSVICCFSCREKPSSPPR